MADIKDLKITEDKTRGKHVADLPVNPTENGMSAQELQGHFDALPELTIDAINDLIDALVENGFDDEITAESVGALPNNDASGVRKSINFIGTNPIATPEGDTVANWIALGSGWAYINSNGKLNRQPTQWGFVENIVADGLCYQVWHSMTTAGTMFHRGGAINNGWYSSGEWFKNADGDYCLWGLSDIGLTNDSFGEDVLTNFFTIYSKLPSGVPYYMQINPSYTLGASIKNKLAEDTGFTTSTYYDMICTKTSADMMQVRLYPLTRSDAMYYAREYSCAFRKVSDTALYLTPFVLTQSDKGFYGEHNVDALTSKLKTVSDVDITAGTTALDANMSYLVYE